MLLHQYLISWIDIGASLECVCVWVWPCMCVHLMLFSIRCVKGHRHFQFADVLLSFSVKVSGTPVSLQQDISLLQLIISHCDIISCPADSNFLPFTREIGIQMLHLRWPCLSHILVVSSKRWTPADGADRKCQGYNGMHESGGQRSHISIVNNFTSLINIVLATVYFYWQFSDDICTWKCYHRWTLTQLRSLRLHFGSHQNHSMDLGIFCNNES